MFTFLLDLEFSFALVFRSIFLLIGYFTVYVLLWIVTKPTQRERLQIDKKVNHSRVGIKDQFSLPFGG